MIRLRYEDIAVKGIGWIRYDPPGRALAGGTLSQDSASRRAPSWAIIVPSLREAELYFNGPVQPQVPGHQYERPMSDATLKLIEDV